MGASVRISTATHARVVLACETLKITVAEFIDRAALASLQRQEEAGRVKAYELACSAAEAARMQAPARKISGCRVIMAFQPTRNPARTGWVYVLTNPAYAGVVKVGHTGRHPETRAAELSTTGVPTPFVVAYAHQVKDHEALEGLTHGRLDAYRVNQGREFFKCSVGQARRIIEQEARAQLLPWWRVLLHRLIHPLPAAPRRAWGSGRRRRSRGDAGASIAVVVGLAIGGVVMFRPYWIPPGLLHLLRQLPGLH